MAAFQHWSASREGLGPAGAMGAHTSALQPLVFTSAGPTAYLRSPASHPSYRPGPEPWNSPWEFSPPPSSLAVDDARLLPNDYFGSHPPAHAMYGSHSEYDSDLSRPHALSTAANNAPLAVAKRGPLSSAAHHPNLQYPINLTGLATPIEDVFGSGSSRESYVRTNLQPECSQAWHAPLAIPSEHPYSLVRTASYPPEPIECVPAPAKRSSSTTKVLPDSAHPKHNAKKKGENNNSHRAVEKRYRKNLNAKIAELQRCITAVDASLELPHDRKRSTSPCEGESDVEWGDDVKVQKGVILTNAAECIRNLHLRNVDLERQNRQLASKLAHL